MAEKKLNIEPALIKHAKFVLERDDIPYTQDEDGNILEDLTEEEEEILIEDALCEEQRLRVNPEIPVYSFRTMCNREKFDRLQKLNWGDDPDEHDGMWVSGPFHPLEQDQALFLDEDDVATEEDRNTPIPGVTPDMPFDEAYKIMVEYEIKKRKEQ